MTQRRSSIGSRVTAAAATMLVATAAAVVDPAISRAGDDFAIDQHQFANGGISRARNECFDLSATLGQAIAGASSGGGFDLTAGFWATQVNVRTDSIFNEGFEDCQP